MSCSAPDNGISVHVAEFVKSVTPLIDAKDYKGCRQLVDSEITAQIAYVQNKLGLTDLSEEELNKFKALAELTATQAHDKVISGEVEQQDLVKSLHIEKITRADQLRGIATWCFREGLTPVEPNDGRLTGFVMSVKDSIYVTNAPATCGLMINLDRVPTKDAEMMQKLKNAGAVITTKGAVPMLLFSMECESNIFGTGCNPYDCSRTTGGSSGGDSALVKGGFVNAAIGSDVAGSSRIPALCCGVHGFKPSPFRLGVGCHAGWDSRIYGSDWNSDSRSVAKAESQFLIPCTIGPTARSVKDLEKIMSVLCQPHEVELDMSIVPLPWQMKPLRNKRIGLVKSIPFCTPSAASARALRMAADGLISQGYEIIDISDKLGPLLDDAAMLCLQGFEKSQGFFDIITKATPIHEPVSSLYDTMKFIARIPKWFISSMAWAGLINGRLKKIVENNLEAANITQAKLKEKQIILYRNIRETMAESNVVALLSPGLPVAAPTHLTSNSMMWICCYLYCFNFLQMPSGVLTVTHIQEDEQFYEDEYNDSMTEGLKATMSNSKGLPMGVSISAPCYEDEVAMQIMLDLENSGKIEPCEILRKPVL